jgi:hypothetical protein
MLKIMSALLLLAAGTSATAADRRFTVTGFDRVQVDGPYEVTLATGRSTSAIASGTPVALDGISIDVQGRTLRIKPKRGSWGGYPGEDAGPVKIALGTASLKGAVLSGSGSLAIDKVSGMRADLSLSGSGRLAVGAVTADSLSVASLGAGTLAIGGKVKNLRAAIQGAGALEGEGLSADDAVVNAATSGEIALSVRRAANVTSSGSGGTRIIGSPACTVKRSGAGPVRCGASDQRHR